jgi:AcrR family transcriptional regulator
LPQEAAIDGLRERKKRETRSALTWAAVRLAVERGFASVTVEDIASAAGVSSRTFNNYFSSKAEAIVARHVDRLQAIAAELRVRPREEALWAAIGVAVITQFRGEGTADCPPHGQWAAGVKLMFAEPAVQAEFLRASRIVERDIAAAIADRIGIESDALYPLLAAATVGALVRVSIEQWLRGDPPLSLPKIIESAHQRMGRISDASPLAPAPSPPLRTSGGRS